MTRSHKRDNSRMQDRQVRHILRTTQPEVEMELALQHRKNDIRMTLPRICWDEYQQPPKWIDAYFLTGPRLFLVDLPDPGGDGRDG